MEGKANLAQKRKRELLGSFNKRKMSLRKYMDNLKQNECRLDISQITKCVFLGALCLKPVPHLFDSPLMFEDFETRMWNETSVKVNDETVNREIVLQANEKIVIKNETSKKASGKKNGKGKKMYKVNIKQENGEPGERVDIKKELPCSNKKEENCRKSKKKVTRIKEKTNNLTAVQNSTKVILEEPEAIENNDSLKKDLLDVEVPDQNKELLTYEEILLDNETEVSRNSEIPPYKESSVETNSTTNITPSENNNEVVITEKSMEITNTSSCKENERDVPSFNNEISTLENLNLLPYEENSVETSTKAVQPSLCSNEASLKHEKANEVISQYSEDDEMENEMLYSFVNIKMEKHVFDSLSESEEFKDISPKGASEDRSKKYMKRTPQCKICSQVFSNYIKLKKHKKDHDGDKPYLCVQCGTNHETLDQLIAHLRIHKGKRPYLCKKCNKGFKTIKALENHEPVHVLRKIIETKKKFQCEVCSKEFRKLCDLERHTRVHTGEKPSICNICNRRFQQAHNLNKHLLIHTQEKPYQCDICNKKFGRYDVLNRHLLTHSVNKPNHCVHCMKSFIRVSQLMSHMEKYHPQNATVI